MGTGKIPSVRNSVVDPYTVHTFVSKQVVSTLDFVRNVIIRSACIIKILQSPLAGTALGHITNYLTKVDGDNV